MAQEPRQGPQGGGRGSEGREGAAGAANSFASQLRTQLAHQRTTAFRSSSSRPGAVCVALRSPSSSSAGCRCLASSRSAAARPKWSLCRFSIIRSSRLWNSSSWLRWAKSWFCTPQGCWPQRGSSPILNPCWPKGHQSGEALRVASAQLEWRLLNSRCAPWRWGSAARSCRWFTTRLASGGRLLLTSSRCKCTTWKLPTYTVQLRVLRLPHELPQVARSALLSRFSGV